MERCGILDLTFNDGNDVMADKGFTIEGLLPLSMSLNIPSFLDRSDQMPPEDVLKRTMHCCFTNSCKESHP